MPVIVIVITRSAANFCRLAIHQRDDGVVGKTTALDAVIVNNIA